MCVWVHLCASQLIFMEVLEDNGDMQVGEQLGGLRLTRGLA